MHKIQKDLLAASRNTNLGEKSLRDIGQLIGIDHPQKVSHHLNQLEKKGFLIIDKANNLIENVNNRQEIESNFINIPIVGSANCGPASLLALENISGHVKVSKSSVPNSKLYALVADGDSMNQANIEGEAIDNGDYVIVQPHSEAKHGDYVVAVADGAANIKRFHVNNDGDISLVSESTNPNHTPIFIDPEDADDFFINGKVVKVMKQPKF